MSRVEVGKVMGLGYERVRQLELRALAKLRASGVELDGYEDSEDQDDMLPVPRPRQRVRLRVIAEQGELAL